MKEIVNVERERERERELQAQREREMEQRKRASPSKLKPLPNQETLYPHINDMIREEREWEDLAKHRDPFDTTRYISHDEQYPNIIPEEDEGNFNNNSKGHDQQSQTSEEINEDDLIDLDSMPTVAERELYILYLKTDEGNVYGPF